MCYISGDWAEWRVTGGPKAVALTSRMHLVSTSMQHKPAFWGHIVIFGGQSIVIYMGQSIVIYVYIYIYIYGAVYSHVWGSL